MLPAVRYGSSKVMPLHMLCTGLALQLKQQLWMLLEDALVQQPGSCNDLTQPQARSVWAMAAWLRTHCMAEPAYHMTAICLCNK